jgi:hypothetical protein
VGVSVSEHVAAEVLATPRYRGVHPDAASAMGRSLAQPRALAAYRCTVAVCLAAFCAEQALSHVAFLAPQGLAPQTLHQLASAWLGQLAPERLWTIAGILSLFSACGRQANVSALALLALSALHAPTSSAGAASAAPIVSFATLWLSLLPRVSWAEALPGAAFSLSRAPELRSTRTLDHLTRPLLLVHLSLIYTNVSFWQATIPGWRFGSVESIAACLVPGLMAMGSTGLARTLTVTVMLAVHLQLALWSHQWWPQLMLASSAWLLFVPARYAEAESDSRTEASVQVDARTAVAVAFSCLVLVLLAAQLTGWRSAAEAAGAMLDDLGALTRLYTLRARP